MFDEDCQLSFSGLARTVGQLRGLKALLHDSSQCRLKVWRTGWAPRADSPGHRRCNSSDYWVILIIRTHS